MENARGSWSENELTLITVNLLSLDGDGSFRANRGSETIKTVGD